MRFDKYWEEKNNVIVLASVLDPRLKMRYIEWCFGEMHAEETVKTETLAVGKELETLYDKCVAQDKLDGQGASVSSSKSSSIPTPSMPRLVAFKFFLSTTSSRISKTRYAVLAKMAKRF